MKPLAIIVLVACAFLSGCSLGETNEQEKMRKQGEWKAEGYFIGEGESDSMGTI